MPFSSDKYEALVFYAKNRGEKVEDYMGESLDEWYRKKVDTRVRKYLDAKYELEFGTPPGPLTATPTEPEMSADPPAWES